MKKYINHKFESINIEKDNYYFFKKGVKKDINSIIISEEFIKLNKITINTFHRYFWEILKINEVKEAEFKIDNIEISIEQLKDICDSMDCSAKNQQEYLSEYFINNFKINQNLEIDVRPYINIQKYDKNKKWWYIHDCALNINHEKVKVYYYDTLKDGMIYHVIGDVNYLEIKNNKKEIISIDDLEYKEVYYYILNKPIVRRLIISIPKNFTISNHIINKPTKILKINNKFNKNILFMDRLEVADDSAIYMFEYCLEKKMKNIFFVIEENNEYEKLKKIFPNVLQLGSKEFEKKYLNAKLLVSTSLNPKFENYKGWRYGKNIKVMCKYIFLQHGFITDDLSNWLFAKRFQKMLLTNQLEYSIVEKYYSVLSEQLVITGLPRYDKLTNDIPKTILLIAPTWRHYFPKKKDEFIDNWNAVMKSKKIQAYADENNLEIVFKIHENLREYQNEFILESTKEEYSKILKKTKLLITDYSSIFIDINIQNQKVLFYQFDKEYFYAHHTYKQAIKYEDLKVGKVCEKLEEVENNLNDNVHNKLFENDFKNRERVYNLIINNKNN